MSVLLLSVSAENIITMVSLRISTMYFNFVVFLFLFYSIHFSAKATYAAISRTYSYLTPDLWKDEPLEKLPYQQHADFLAKASIR